MLAWKINAKAGSFGTYYKDELKRGMRLERYVIANVPSNPQSG